MVQVLQALVGCCFACRVGRRLDGVGANRWDAAKAGRATYHRPGARQAKALAKIPNGAAGGPYWEVFQVSTNCRH